MDLRLSCTNPSISIHSFLCWCLSGLVLFYNHFLAVLPSSFVMKHAPMPIELGTNITATCTADAVLREPRDFYWTLGDYRSTNEHHLHLENIADGLYRVTSTYIHTILKSDDGLTLECVIILYDGHTMIRTLLIDVIGVGADESDAAGESHVRSDAQNFNHFKAGAVYIQKPNLVITLPAGLQSHLSWHSVRASFTNRDGLRSRQG